ncbi:hypothetical protein [Synechococcus sp. SYN20]|nr:hypothetical protein [Synechococcus sp. SYN20]
MTIVKRRSSGRPWIWCVLVGSCGSRCAVGASNDWTQISDSPLV